jgi:hypothetical protein
LGLSLNLGDHAWDIEAVITQRIRLAGIEYLFCDAREPAPSDGRLLGARELQALVVDHGSSPGLRALIGEAEGERPEQLRNRGAYGFERPSERVLESLRCFEIRPVIPHVVGEILIPELPELRPFEPNEIDEALHWIEIQVVGEDDEAIAGIECEITLPSGKHVRRTTDRLGLVRIEGITTPGQCSLTFPRLDASAWEPA